jgi:hypothetical protein
LPDPGTICVRDNGAQAVAEDIPLLQSLTTDVFPGVTYSRQEMDELKKIIVNVCKERHLIAGLEEEEIGYMWMEKILQLYQVGKNWINLFSNVLLCFGFFYLNVTTVK